MPVKVICPAMASGGDGGAILLELGAAADEDDVDAGVRGEQGGGGVEHGVDALHGDHPADLGDDDGVGGEVVLAAEGVAEARVRVAELDAVPDHDVRGGGDAEGLAGAAG